MSKVRRSISLDGDGYVEKTTLYIDEDVHCTYYPATRNMCIENDVTGECIILNYQNWAKVYEWLRAVTRNRNL